MKRFFAAFLLFFCCFAFCSCSSTQAPRDITSVEAEVSVGNIEYTLQADKTDDGSIIVTAISPQNVSGISYCYEDDALTVAYGELKCMTDRTFLPKHAVAGCLCDAIAALPAAQFEKSENGTNNFISGDGRFLYQSTDTQITKITDQKYGYSFSLK